MALGIVGAADEHGVDLAGRDTGLGDPQRINASHLLAHEGPRRARHAVHDGDVAARRLES
jgi:hypothetical protein